MSEKAHCNWFEDVHCSGEVIGCSDNKRNIMKQEKGSNARSL